MPKEPPARHLKIDSPSKQLSTLSTPPPLIQLRSQRRPTSALRRRIPKTASLTPSRPKQAPSGQLSGPKCRCSPRQSISPAGEGGGLAESELRRIADAPRGARTPAIHPRMRAGHCRRRGVLRGHARTPIHAIAVYIRPTMSRRGIPAGRDISVRAGTAASSDSTAEE